MSLIRQSPSQVERICKSCNVVFFLHQYRLNAGEDKGLFCSVACRRKSRHTKIEIPCQRCGTLFWEVPSVIAIGQGKFCSSACAHETNTTNWTERVCQRCDATFDVKISELNRGGGKFCSRDCYEGRPLKSLEERFWEKIDKNGPLPEHCPELGNCWLWTGANNGETSARKWPYGVIGKGRKEEGTMRTHVLSWQLHNGTIPEGMNVLHRCDATLCCRPDHLMLGTPRDNMQDMIAKGRARFTGRPPGSHLSPESLESFRKKRGYK